jgi:hypothetical protein
LALRKCNFCFSYFSFFIIMSQPFNDPLETAWHPAKLAGGRLFEFDKLVTIRAGYDNLFLLALKCDPAKRFFLKSEGFAKVLVEPEAFLG